MSTRGITISITLAIVFAASCLAADQFRIPNERAKALIGAWRVVAVGEGEEAKPVSAERAMSFIFRADGSGVQLQGKRETPIVWGADNKGIFACQWKQDDGNGDGVMGTWKTTEKGIKLAIREYEDGKHPEADHGVLILKQEKKTPNKPDAGDGE